RAMLRALRAPPLHIEQPSAVAGRLPVPAPAAVMGPVNLRLGAPSLRATASLGALICAMACSDDSALARLGEGCTLTSDCDAGLECVFGHCHEACATSKDCPAGQCV